MMITIPVQVAGDHWLNPDQLTGNDSFDPRMEEYYDKYVEIHKS